MNIVSLLPSTTEICFALGLGDILCGVTHECDYPPRARALPHLTRNILPDGDHSSIDIDRLISERILNHQSIYDLDRVLLARLEPDLILTQQLCDVCAVSYDEVMDAASTLHKMPRVASFEPRSIAEILDSIVEIAQLSGVPEAGKSVVDDLLAQLGEIARVLTLAEPVRAVCLEWLDPPMVGGHWVPEMVRLAGGVDLLGPEGMPSIPVSWSELVDADPDVIVLMPCGYDLDTTIEKAAELQRVEAWPLLRAVREGRVTAVDGSGYFNRPGPRVVDGVRILAEIFHTERFRSSVDGPGGGQFSGTSHTQVHAWSQYPTGR